VAWPQAAAAPALQRFPWFKDATIRQLTAVKVERGHVLRWPELDVDLDVRRIEDPARYPLVSGRLSKRHKARSLKRRQRGSARVVA
jgi:hypothetical protein